MTLLIAIGFHTEPKSNHNHFTDNFADQIQSLPTAQRTKFL